MKLKAKKKTEPRDTNTCQASRCRQTEGLVAFAPGVRFDAKEGEVNLCPKHVAMSDPAPDPVNNEAALAEVLAEEQPQVIEGISPVYPDSPGRETQLMAEASEAQEILQMVEQFEILTQDDMNFANECLGEVKAKLKALEKEKKEVTKPLNDSLKKVRGWFKPAIDFYKNAETAWKSRMAAWQRVQDEAQRQALAQVEAAHQQGDAQGVAQAMTQASQATTELPSNVSMRERWVVDIVDPYAVPPQYWSPDIAKIQAAVTEGIREIPGCAIRREDIVVHRGS